MKWLWWVIPPLVLCLILAGCSARDRGREETGAFHDWSDPNAPKTIESKEIISFEYEFNCESLNYHVQNFPYIYCSFSLARQKDEALCKVWGDSRYDDSDVEFEFMVPLSALNDLQAIVDEHNLASVNGTVKKTDGVPEYLGSSLSVKYASEEKIYASDNSGYVLGSEASLEIYNFFGTLAQEAGHNFVDTVDTTDEMEETEPEHL